MSRRSQLDEIYREFAKFENAMKELKLMRLVINDLKSFKRMLKIRKYD
ncbi:hypothetical protein H5T51_01200 [Candidatus Bathyarchaeota archaeon]|nr:hypothetical protein [Candidatus Bathyarchaeota archaeon]